MKLHRLEREEHYVRQRGQFCAAIEHSLKLLRENRANLQMTYGQLCSNSIRLGCIALILGPDDDEARRRFRDAAEYALKWLEAPVSAGRMRVYDVQLEASPEGVRTIAMHEKPQLGGPSGLSVIDFSRILHATVAFGERGSFETLAMFHEDGYRNPNVIAGPGEFAEFRAWKALLLGDEKQARKEAESSLKATRETAPRAGLSAFLALIAGKQGDFEDHLSERVQGHREHYRKQPNLPEGIVCMDGLALCRLAVDRGLRVAEWPYLPVRFLPNYAPL